MENGLLAKALFGLGFFTGIAYVIVGIAGAIPGRDTGMTRRRAIRSSGGCSS